VIITRGIGNTYYSQGGIAAVVSKEDSTAWHVLDTLRAGRNLGDVKNIEILATRRSKSHSGFRALRC